MFNQLQPANPTMSDMQDARAELVLRRPYGQAPITANITVTRMYQYKGVWYFVCKPDAPHLTEKHMSEFEFEQSLIRYLPKVQPTVIEKATAA
jgi:hypothetical protein